MKQNLKHFLKSRFFFSHDLKTKKLNFQKCLRLIKTITHHSEGFNAFLFELESIVKIFVQITEL